MTLITYQYDAFEQEDMHICMLPLFLEEMEFTFTYDGFVECNCGCLFKLTTITGRNYWAEYPDGKYPNATIISLDPSLFTLKGAYYTASLLPEIIQTVFDEIGNFQDVL